MDDCRMEESSSEESTDSDEVEINEKFHQLLTQARTCFREKVFGLAFAQYLILIKSQKPLRKLLNQEFIAVLECWTEQLMSEGKIEQVFNCYKQSMAFYPASAVLCNSLGATLFKLGFYNEATEYFNKAIKMDPSLHQVKESLESVSNLLVERWHFRMLNDHTRNNAYMTAINKAVNQGYDVVMDIGSGTGILSMLAARAGAKLIYACEMSKVMCEMSRNILTANQMEKKIQLFNKKSNDMTIGDDIPQNVTLVVTEIMDCALLGEGIIPTLKHAWKHLITPTPSRESPLLGNSQGVNILEGCEIPIKQRAKVIPCGATVIAMIVECKTIRTQNRLKREICGMKIPDVQGADTEYGSKNCFDPYGSEYMNTIKGGFTPLSEPFVVAEYNFSRANEFELDGSKEFAVPVTADGIVDAAVLWFDLDLDEVTRISTAPWSSNLCWEQAVYPARIKRCTTQDSLRVSPGFKVLISAKLNENYVRLEMVEIQATQSDAAVNAINAGDTSDPGNTSHAEGASYFISAENASDANCDDMSSLSDYEMHTKNLTYGPTIPEPMEMSHHNGKETCKAVFYEATEHENGLKNKGEAKWVKASPQMDRRWNKSTEASNTDPISLSCSDIRRINDEVYQKWYMDAIKISQTASLDKISVLDMCESTSLSPMFATMVTNNEVTMLTQKSESIHFIKNVEELNGARGLIKYSRNTLQELVSCKDRFNIIIADVVEACGVFRQRVLEDIWLVKECLLDAEQHKIIPSAIKVYGQCISCLELVKENRIINDDVTLGLDIARFMNEYSVDTHIDVDLAAKNYEALTEQFELLNIEFQGNTTHESVHQQTVVTRVIRDGIITGLPYWFELGVSSQGRLSTAPDGYEGSHWHQAVVMLKEGVEVWQGDQLAITCVCKDSCISLSVSKA